jgi:hypothetical protein
MFYTLLLIKSHCVRSREWWAKTACGFAPKKWDCSLFVRVCLWHCVYLGTEITKHDLIETRILLFGKHSGIGSRRPALTLDQLNARMQGGTVLRQSFSCYYFRLFGLYIHTYIPLTLYPRRGSRGVRYSSETPTFYQNYLAMRNTADVTGGKPIAIWLQSISGVSAINPLVASYDILGRKREVLFFYFVLDTTRDSLV